MKSENDGSNMNATGSVTICSKEVNIEAIDYEYNVPLPLFCVH